MPVVQRFAGVLFQMKAFDADRHGIAIGHIEHDLALPDNRRLVLTDLIALRQVGIEIILAVKRRSQIDLCLQPETGADRLLDASLVDDRQHPGHRGIH
jgi:hypothetical protein